MCPLVALHYPCAVQHSPQRWSPWRSGVISPPGAEILDTCLPVSLRPLKSGDGEMGTPSPHRNEEGREKTGLPICPSEEAPHLNLLPPTISAVPLTLQTFPLELELDWVSRRSYCLFHRNRHIFFSKSFIYQSFK